MAVESDVLLRHADLGDNHTRFDNIVAAPSDQELFSMWLWWGMASGFVAIIVIVVFLGVALNAKVRRNAFNLYLVFLMVPDIVFSSTCCVSCLLSLAVGRYFSDKWCYFQSFFNVFGIGANAWLNAVIAREIHKMLRWSNSRRRYFKPPRKTVVIQSLAVYTWSSFIALLPVLEIPWLPHRVRLHSGAACLPLEYDRGSSIYFYLVFLPLFALIPVIYVGWVTYDVLRNGLLPRSGKTRSLAIYFFRLAVVFVVMWLPTLVLIFITASLSNPWAAWSGGLWGHFQGAVSAIISLMKPDVAGAVKKFITCQGTCAECIGSGEEEETVSGVGGSSKFGFGSSRGSILVRKETNRESQATACTGTDVEDPMPPQEGASQDFASEELDADYASNDNDNDVSLENDVPEAAPCTKEQMAASDD